MKSFVDCQITFQQSLYQKLQDHMSILWMNELKIYLDFCFNQKNAIPPTLIRTKYLKISRKNVHQNYYENLRSDIKC